MDPFYLLDKLFDDAMMCANNCDANIILLTLNNLLIHDSQVIPSYKKIIYILDKLIDGTQSYIYDQLLYFLIINHENDIICRLHPSNVHRIIKYLNYRTMTFATDFTINIALQNNNIKFINNIIRCIQPNKHVLASILNAPMFSNDHVQLLQALLEDRPSLAGDFEFLIAHMDRNIHRDAILQSLITSNAKKENEPKPSKIVYTFPKTTIV